MIVYAAHCPYCDQGNIGIDTDRLEIVFNPDRNAPRPCDHLACFNGALVAGPQCGTWIWLRGQRSLDDLVPREADNELKEYLLDIILHEWDFADLLPPRPYMIMGGTADEREHCNPGNGEPLLSRPNEPERWGTLDFWAIYAPDPMPFATALPDLVRRVFARYRSLQGHPAGTRVEESGVTQQSAFPGYQQTC